VNSAPRLAISSVFFAELARDVSGDINPLSVSIAGNTVIDDSGKWVGDPTGLQGADGADSTVAGPPGADSTVAGPAGPPGASCTVSACTNDEATITCGASTAILSCNRRYGYTPRNVFITNERFTSDFGGMAAGDAACKEEAEEAGLPGQYKVWLSDRSADAYERMSGAWRYEKLVRPDGVEVAASGHALIRDGNPLQAIKVNAAGDSTGGGLVWTGTDADGRWTGFDSGDWQARDDETKATVGRVERDFTYGEEWTEAELWGGVAPARNGGYTVDFALYCMEQ
jgi:hypothetical protein